MFLDIFMLYPPTRWHPWLFDVNVCVIEILVVNRSQMCYKDLSGDIYIYIYTYVCVDVRTKLKSLRKLSTLSEGNNHEKTSRRFLCFCVSLSLISLSFLCWIYNIEIWLAERTILLGAFLSRPTKIQTYQTSNSEVHRLFSRLFFSSNSGILYLLVFLFCHSRMSNMHSQNTRLVSLIRQLIKFA